MAASLSDLNISRAATFGLDDKGVVKDRKRADLGLIEGRKRDAT